MAETKVTSVRADEETTAQFKSLLEQFPNGTECLKTLLNAYELEQAKGILTGQGTDISDFQSHADSLVRAYITALDLTANAENRIRSEFRDRLDSKDKTIQELQHRVEVAEQLAQNAQEQAETLERNMSEMNESNATLIDELDKKTKSAEQRLEEMSDAVSTSKTLIASLQEQLSSAKESTSRLPDLEERLSASQLAQCTAETRADEFAKQLEQERKSAALAKEYAQIEKEKAVLAEREKSSVKFQELTEKINQLYEKISNQSNQIHVLRVENDTLKKLAEKSSLE